MSMKKAYLETINDFEIELRSTPWWNFRTVNRLTRHIEHYENKLDKLYGFT